MRRCRTVLDFIVHEKTDADGVYAEELLVEVVEGANVQLSGAKSESAPSFSLADYAIS